MGFNSSADDNKEKETSMTTKNDLFSILALLRRCIIMHNTSDNQCQHYLDVMICACLLPISELKKCWHVLARQHREEGIQL